MSQSDQIQESISYWEMLAAESDRLGDWERDHGRYDGVYRNKAESYRSTAQALRMEAEDGISRCACCLRPLTGRDHWKR